MGDKLTKQKPEQIIITISCSNPKYLHNITVLLNDAPDKAKAMLPLLPQGARFATFSMFTASNGSHHMRIYFEVEV